MLIEIGEFLRDFWGAWLMALFLGILVWVLWPRNKDRLERHGRIPLDMDS